MRDRKRSVCPSTTLSVHPQPCRPVVDTLFGRRGVGGERCHWLRRPPKDFRPTWDRPSFPPFAGTPPEIPVGPHYPHSRFSENLRPVPVVKTGPWTSPVTLGPLGPRSGSPRTRRSRRKRKESQVIETEIVHDRTDGVPRHPATKTLLRAPVHGTECGR